MTIKTPVIQAILPAILAASLLFAGCVPQSAGGGGSAQAPPPAQRQFTAQEARDAAESTFRDAAERGLYDYRGAPLKFIGEPQPCSVPADPRDASPTAKRLQGTCVDFTVTIYEGGKPIVGRWSAFLRAAGDTAISKIQRLD